MNLTYRNGRAELPRFTSAALRLLSDPREEPGEAVVLLQRRDGVVRPPQLLLIGKQAVNRVVALVAHRDRLLHLLACEPLLEPLVSVAGPRNQVVFRGPAFRAASAESAGRMIGVRRRADHKLPAGCP